MRWVFCASAFFAFACVGSASGDPIYYTRAAPPGPRIASGKTDVFIAPYTTRVATTLSASISKTAAAGNAGGAGNAQKPTSAAPTVSSAVHSADKQITYVVSCDLSSVLQPGDKVTVLGTRATVKEDKNAKEFDVTGTVINRGINGSSLTLQLTTELPEPNAPYVSGSGASITNVFCPSGDTFAITLAVSASPAARGYLYLHRNAFFDDNVDFSVGTDGMLSSSDTVSTQEITAILTELAQTAAAAGFKIEDAPLQPPPAPTEQEQQKKLDADVRSVCYKAITSLVQTTPFYDTVEFDQIADKTIPGDESKLPENRSKLVIFPQPGPKGSPKDSASRGSTLTWTIPVKSANIPGDPNDDSVSIRFRLTTRIDSYSQAVGKYTRTGSFPGFVAFFPVAATARAECVVKRQIPAAPVTGATSVTSTFLMSPQSVVNLYTESHLLDPQRDFLTNPHDTFTFTAGLITGHKFTGQSAAKTVVDTITAPIRALMPSVTVTQSVAVSPTGKTTTTSTQTAPPKGP
jgi:hypothetical protein